MSKTLDVYLSGQCIGDLEQDKTGQLRFTYALEWINDSSSFAISCSLPLQKESFTQKECRPFFAGVLPEDATRRLIGKNLGISANNDFSMLEKIGGECAGAISFISKNKSAAAGSNNYRELSVDELATILERLHTKPLLAGDEHIRLSMAGVQDKIPLCYKDNKYFLPLDNSPSTHIIKPENKHFPGLIENEHFCMQLAKKINLYVANAQINQISEKTFLLVERYDRLTSDDTILRLHQEDFCQALGIVPEKKYQNEGGPSFKDCFNLLRRFSSLPAIELQKLLEALIFNMLIGNCDAHGKNFSLLYNNGITFSPLYDLVCTLYYGNLTSKMAMKIGKEYDAKKININHFKTLAAEIGFSVPGVCQEVERLSNQLLSILDAVTISNDVEARISEIIRQRCLFLR